MTARIFLRCSSGELTPLDEQPYDSEDLLQENLEKHPDLLAGYQINESEPRRWIFIRREKGIEDASGTSRWSVDHVFIDQDAVPTLIEVKRSSDTRIRREVVGQLLEYGANAVTHWPAGALRASFEARCEAAGVDMLGELQACLGSIEDLEVFWQQVEENLRSGRVRLLFAADRIPPELQRIVEFLNDQMNPAEVLALEIRQFVGGGMQTFVPRVLGNSMSARDQKRSAPSRATAWTAEEFVGRLRASGFESQAEVAQAVIRWAQSRELDLVGGRGGKAATLYVQMPGGDSLRPFCLYEGYGGGGTLQLQLDKMGRAGQEPTRSQICARLAQVTGDTVDPARAYPGIPLSRLVNSTGVLLEAMDSVLVFAKSTAHAGRDTNPEE